MYICAKRHCAILNDHISVVLFGARSTVECDMKRQIRHKQGKIRGKLMYHLLPSYVALLWYQTARPQSHAYIHGLSRSSFCTALSISFLQFAFRPQIFPLSEITNPARSTLLVRLWTVAVARVSRINCPEFHQPVIYLACMVFANLEQLTLSTPVARDCCCSKGLAPYWSNPPFLIFDIRALWRSVMSARAPECQKLKMVG